MSRRVVVIGAGQAGFSLAAKLRELGHAGEITLIGEEPEPPYQRPPLSKKYLLGDFELDRLLLKPREFYAQQRITLLLNEPVTAIDRATRSVATARRRIPYDIVALTTGGLPRQLPEAAGGSLDGVFLMRSRADADALAPELQPGRRALVIGGGYIGLEAASVAAQRGLKVTLIEIAPRILNRVAAPETAGELRKLHQANGVEIREGTGLERLVEKGGRVGGALLDTGETIDCDLAIVGIGISPDTRLAEAAGLHIDNGIAVDGQCRSSDPAIYAAGDCASFPFRGARVRLESVQNAIDQGEHAAKAIHGSPGAYNPVPWFWSDQFSARLQIAGLNLGYDRVIRRPGHRPGGCSIWYFKGNRFLAVDALSDPKSYMQGKRWLESNAAPDPDRLADRDRELREAV